MLNFFADASFISNFLSACLGAASSLIGVYFTLRHTSKSAAAAIAHTAEIDRVKLTFQFYKEFNQSDMNLIRSEVDILLQKYNYKDFKDLTEDVYEQNIKASELNKLWVLISFYSGLSAALKYSQIDLKLVYRLFGSIFVWWYTVYFKRNLIHITEWQDALYIQEFYNSLEKYSYSTKENRSDWEFWVNRAESDINERELKVNETFKRRSLGYANNILSSLGLKLTHT